MPLTVLNDVLQTITDVKLVYTSTTTAFYRDITLPEDTRNIKKYAIDDAYANMAFRKKLLPVYIDYLSHLDRLGTFEFPNEMTQDFRYRIKSKATIQIKMYHNLGKHMYVSKIINDLFGARLILDQMNQSKGEVERLLQEQQKIGTISRFYFREDGLYRAWHCYFQDSNRHFAWELQLWDALDARNNFLAHVSHDQERDTL